MLLAHLAIAVFSAIFGGAFWHFWLEYQTDQRRRAIKRAALARHADRQAKLREAMEHHQRQQREYDDD